MRIQRRTIFISILIVVVGLFAALGFRYWYQPTYDYYSTDQASVTGNLARVAAPASGRVDSVSFDVGSTVAKDGLLAQLKVVAAAAPPAAIAGSGTTVGPAVPSVLARVTSPIDGTVASRDVNVGDTVAAGQPIATIVNLNDLWVVVNADEARVAEVKVGQTASVYIDAVNETFQGKVTDIGSATTDVTAPASVSTFGSSDSTKRVPVKVVFDYTGFRLVPGMSATVTIDTHISQ